MEKKGTYDPNKSVTSKALMIIERKEKKKKPKNPRSSNYKNPKKRIITTANTGLSGKKTRTILDQLEQY